MIRYKITVTTLSGDSDERETECGSDAQAAGSALLLLATLGPADEPLGAKAEDAARAARPGLKSPPSRAQQAMAERNSTVRLFQKRLEVPASVAAGETTFAITNARTEARGFKLSGLGLQRELGALLPPARPRCWP